MQMQHFFFPDLGKGKLCSVLVFGNVCFNIVVRINHDNVASRGLLDVLTPLSDCRQESVEKMERRISGVSYMYWICTTGFRVVGFMCSVNFSLSFPTTTPRATTPHRYPTGYHAQGYHALTTTARLSRLCIYPGYHAIV